MHTVFLLTKKKQETSWTCSNSQMMGAQSLFIFAGILFVVGLMLALVVLLWAVGGWKKCKAFINSAVKSPTSSISDGMKGESSSDETVYKQSSDETVYAEEDGAPCKGSYDLTPVVEGESSYDLTPIVEGEALTPNNERSDASFIEELETPTKSEVKKENIGSHLKYLCVIERTYPQFSPSRGAFISLEDDTSTHTHGFRSL